VGGLYVAMGSGGLRLGVLGLLDDGLELSTEAENQRWWLYSAVTKVSGSRKEKKNSVSYTMLVERDCGETYWLY
jgi:hypothetical protein